MEQHNDLRLIEAGFPCHQVGAETQRERGSSNVMPPVYYLHVWWARRPLTPSRAAIVASLDPADTDPSLFVRQLGIERVEALVHDKPWTISGALLEKIEQRNGAEVLVVDKAVLRALAAETLLREENKTLLARLINMSPHLATDPVLKQWDTESEPLPLPWPEPSAALSVQRVMGDPAWFKDLMAIASAHKIRLPNLYGYDRAYATNVHYQTSNLTVLDPTAGGGSMPLTINHIS